MYRACMYGLNVLPSRKYPARHFIAVRLSYTAVLRKQYPVGVIHV